jgi:hypothetical protein
MSRPNTYKLTAKFYMKLQYTVRQMKMLHTYVHSISGLFFAELLYEILGRRTLSS